MSTNRTPYQFARFETVDRLKFFAELQCVGSSERESYAIDAKISTAARIVYNYVENLLERKDTTHLILHEDGTCSGYSLQSEVFSVDNFTRVFRTYWNLSESDFYNIDWPEISDSPEGMGSTVLYCDTSELEKYTREYVIKHRLALHQGNADLDFISLAIDCYFESLKEFKTLKPPKRLCKPLSEYIKDLNNGAIDRSLELIEGGHDKSQ